jgi:hypothetical protein
VQVDPTQASAPQAVDFEQVVHFCLASDPRLRQRSQFCECHRPILEVSQGKLADDKRMAPRLPIVE